MIGARLDVCIFGGGVVGSAVADTVKRLAPAAAVVVVEPDSTYGFASTLRASGGARRQFSCPENIGMSNFSVPFIAHADETLAVGGVPAHVEWRAGGYLFIVPHAALDTLRRNCDVQPAHGVDADWLDAHALHTRFPSMNLEGIAAGVHTRTTGGAIRTGCCRGCGRRLARLAGAERTGWQSGDRPRVRSHGERPCRRRILGTRDDARGPRPSRHRRTDRASAIRDARS